ncbi:MAG: HlyD family type I secretion periplasmic adaptor subunit [Sulfurimonas sp.]|jgi:epimerase transport system membrane fusion protein|uniref:HlyD family type I secretion periplasmic adaptor subunit n=1 Tax=unclassified Sulfurimonas TaxID=2623549 RepID=UPI000A3FFE64|nr:MULTISPECIES: HlyD family type I secretion periplasmic adaptor subunit [unclassified Sulfurimonas]MBS4067754.1 HlyD family type I secretion periplasmic adaptor subunit [Sulfurimonas sp.]MDD3854336.1 HlyD family type I secretion periplasmic adaptor subunit [Sulfurimonas sp.]
MSENRDIKMPSTNDSKIIGFGLGVIFLLFVVFGGWMAFAPLAESSVAVGKVSADLDKKTLQHLEGGVIESIHVKDGDEVKKGDLLLKLKEINIKSQLDIFKTQYDDASAVYSRLVAQRDNLGKVIYPPELKNESIIKEQNNIFFETKKSIEDEKIISQNRVVQLENQINGLKSLMEAKKSRLKSISEEILEWEKLFKEQLVDKLKIRDLSREKNMIEGDISQTASEIAKLNEAINEARNQQLLREKEFTKETLNDLVKAKSMLFDLQSKIASVEDTLGRTNIVAPIDGTVVGLSLHTVGGVVAPGKDILQIIPQKSKLVVVAQLQTADIDKVKIGLMADIRFSAFNTRETHVIEGKVVHVSADSFVDQKSGMPYYEAKIEVTKEGEKQVAGYGFELVSGMPAEVMIRVSERTMLSYLVKPLTDMISRGFNEE